MAIPKRGESNLIFIRAVTALAPLTHNSYFTKDGA